MIQLPIAQALLRCPPARRSDLSAVLSNGMELMTSDRRVNRSSKGRGPTDPFPYLAPLDGRPPVKNPPTRPTTPQDQLLPAGLGATLTAMALAKATLFYHSFILNFNFFFFFSFISFAAASTF